MIKKSRFFVLATAFVIISCSVDAQVADNQLSEFLKSVSDTIGRSSTKSINNVVFTFMINNKVTEIVDGAEKEIPVYMVKEPPLRDKYVKGVIDVLVSILEPVYATAVAAVGLYLIFSSQFPRGRAFAKALLLSLLVGIILTPLTVDIMRLLLDASRYLSSEILALSDHPADYASLLRPAVNYFQGYMARLMVINVAASLPFMVLTLFFAVGVFAVLVVRYMFVMLLAMLFPLTIFLLFFYYTRRIGEFLLKQTIFWVFLPAAYAASFVVASMGRSAVVSISPVFSVYADIVGAFFIILSPITFFFIINWASTVILPAATIIIRPIGVPAANASKKGASSPRQVASKTKAEKFMAQPKAALGLRGLQRVEEAAEAESKNREKEKESVIARQSTNPEQRKYVSVSTRSIASFRVGASYESDLHSANARIASSGARKSISPPTTDYLGSPETKKGMLVITIPSRATPSIALEIPKGEIDTVNVVVRNETDEPIYKIRVFDEDITSAGIQTAYSQKSFSLRAGEERVFSISFSPLEESTEGIHNGAIVFQTDRGNTSNIEVSIRVLSKEDAGGGKGAESKHGGVHSERAVGSWDKSGSPGRPIPSGYMSRHSIESEAYMPGTSGISSGAVGAGEMERKQHLQSETLPSSVGVQDKSGVMGERGGVSQTVSKTQGDVSGRVVQSDALSSSVGVKEKEIKSGASPTVPPTQKDKGPARRKIVDLDNIDDFAAPQIGGAKSSTSEASTGMKAPRKFIEKAVIEVTRLTAPDSDSLKVSRQIMSLARMHLRAKFLRYKKK